MEFGTAFKDCKDSFDVIFNAVLGVGERLWRAAAAGEGRGLSNKACDGHQHMTCCADGCPVCRRFIEFGAAFKECKDSFDVIINAVSAKVDFSGMMGMLAHDGVAVQVRGFTSSSDRYSYTVEGVPQFQ